MKEKLLFITIAMLCSITWLCGDIVKSEPYDLYNINRRKMIPATYNERSTPVGTGSGYNRQAKKYYQELYHQEAVNKYLSRLKNDPHNKNTLYKLSGIYALLNEPELAAHYVTQAYLNGFQNLRHIGKSRKFKLVRDDPVFINTLESLKTMQAEKNNQ